jgi:hypothetical protein
MQTRITRLAEAAYETLDRLRDLGGALARRLERPPAGVSTLAWIASWLAYGWLALAVLALAHERPVPPPVLEWLLVVAWLAPGNAREGDDGQRITRHWGALVCVLLIGGVLLAVAAHAALPAAWGVALALVVAGAVRREPLELVRWGIGRLTAWSAALAAWWVAWLALAAAALAALHPVVAALDPPAQVVLDAAVQGAAAVVSMLAALAALLLLRRAHAAREAWR